MNLKLSLPESRVVWALSHPTAGGYIRTSPGVGDQKQTLILSQDDPGPKHVELDKLPKWAQDMIVTSIRAGEVNNSGDSIDGAAVKQELIEKPKTKPKSTKTKARKKKS